MSKRPLYNRSRTDGNSHQAESDSGHQNGRRDGTAPDTPLWLCLYAIGCGSLLCALMVWACCAVGKCKQECFDEAQTDPLLAADQTRRRALAAEHDAAHLLLRLEQPRLQAASCEFCGSDHDTRQCPHQGMRGAA